MAIRAKTLTGSVAAGMRGNFLSDPILRPHRPIAVLLWTSASAVGSNYTVFVTRSDTPAPRPQPGDPPAFEIIELQTLGTNPVTIPLATGVLIEPPVRFAFSFQNNSASGVLVVAAYIYEE
jgi:hypothetical protein